jgi:cysteinyl-tRNA synthetase
MLTVDGQKMAKSLGNFITLQDLFTGNHERLEHGFSPQVVRFFMLQAHYRSVLDFSSDSLVAAEKGLKRLRSGMETLSGLTHPKVTDGTVPTPLFPAPQEDEEPKNLEEEVLHHCRSMYLHMSDDFNSARVLADLFEIINRVNAMDTGDHSVDELSPEAFLRVKVTTESMVRDVLGIEPEGAQGENRERLEGLLRMLIEFRSEARKKKDFGRADEIRDRLKELGIQLEDRPDGTTDYTLV